MWPYVYVIITRQVNHHLHVLLATYAAHVSTKRDTAPSAHAAAKPKFHATAKRQVLETLVRTLRRIEFYSRLCFLYRAYCTALATHLA